MKKKLLCVVLACIIALICFVGCNSTEVEYNKELVLNGNLENGSLGWTYFTNEDYKVDAVQIELAPDSVDYQKESALHGMKYYRIGSTAVGSYGYYSQAVKVEKNATYLLSVDVKIGEEIETSSSLGAFVGVAESPLVSVSKVEKTSGWTTIQVCFNNYSFDTVNVRFGVGTDASEVSDGEAYFDNISLKKIRQEDAVGLVAVNLGTKGMSGFDSRYLTTTEGIIFTVILVVLGSALIYGGFVLYRRLKARSLNAQEVEGEEKPINKAKAFFTAPITLILGAIIIGFIVRLVLVITLYGYGVRLNEISIAAEKMAKDGIISYYYSNSNYYTPGVMYLLWLFGLIAKPLGLVSESQGMAIFLKIPSIIADLLIVLVIYLVALKKTDSVRAFIISLFYAIVPFAFLASSVYSSYISIGVLFLLLAFISARDKKIPVLTVYYTLSVFFMAEALWLLPLLIAYAVVVYIKNPETRNAIPISASVSIVASYLLTLPLTWNYFVTGRPFIVLERYFSIFSQNNLFVDGAFNIYGLCNVSGSIVNTAGIVMSAILAGLAMLYAIGLYIKCRDRQKLILLAGYTMLAIYMFTVRMTIFVVIPAIMLMFLYGIYSGERRVIASTLSLSMILSLSSCYELMISKYVPGGINAQQIYISGNDPVMIIFSLFAVVITLFLGYVVFDVAFKEREQKFKGIDQPYFAYLKSKFSFLKRESEEIPE